MLTNFYQKELRIRIFYTPALGNFGIISGRETDFYKCRESFHDYLYENALNLMPKEFAFVCTPIESKKVAKLVQDVEQHLRIKSRTFFLKTNMANVIVVRPARWWRTHIRFQFFTIMLRAGRSNSRSTNLLIRLCKERYFSTTKTAVKRFLAGNTTLRNNKDDYDEDCGEMTGWYDRFHPCNRKKWPATYLIPGGKR